MTAIGNNSNIQSCVEEQEYVETRERFNDTAVATDYVQKKNNLNRSKNKRELACISAALDDVPFGSAVLDLPCGSGRLAPMLLGKGFNITEADYSKPMLEAAERYCIANYAAMSNLGQITFEQQDISNTTFVDKQFSAVICSRLFHHYSTSTLRSQVLKELLRISDGPIVLSFFSNFALSALRFHVTNAIRSRKPNDRIPIWYHYFKKEFTAVGLRCVGYYPVRYGVSPQTYIKLVRIEST